MSKRGDKLDPMIKKLLSFPGVPNKGDEINLLDDQGWEYSVLTLDFSVHADGCLRSSTSFEPGLDRHGGPIPDSEQKSDNSGATQEAHQQDSSGAFEPLPQGVSPLSPKDVEFIIDLIVKSMQGEPGLIKLDSPVMICGDTHGQYRDLLHL
uniref:Uncharacterized protein n=1 Tax=Romanomermis culicivorax TaxID=13658 RepID=A0A915KPF6_ROMCU